MENTTAEPMHQEEHRSLKQPQGEPIRTPAPPSPVPVAGQDCQSVDPEQVFLHRLQQRHGTTVSTPVLVQCIAGELRNWRDWEDFLLFDERQTTAPELLKNPPGHYRQLVRKFYQARAQKRDWQRQQQQLALELQLEAQAQAKQIKPVCPLSQCNGWGEWWNEQGRVVACSCEHGQKLSAKVLEAFAQLNAKLQAEASPPLDKRPPGSELLNLSLQTSEKQDHAPGPFWSAGGSMRVSKTRETPVTAVLRIRGDDKDALELLCEGWEQAIGRVRRWLPHFEQRNPWLYLDSRQQKLYVLLDPETNSCMGHQSVQAQPQTNNVRKKGTHL